METDRDREGYTFTGYTEHGARQYACTQCGTYVLDPALHNGFCPAKAATRSFEEQQRTYEREIVAAHEMTLCRDSQCSDPGPHDRHEIVRDHG